MTKPYYIARPVSHITRAELAGTHGVLVGQYANADSAVKFMINKRGVYGTAYRLYHSDGGPNWRYIGMFRANEKRNAAKQ